MSANEQFVMQVNHLQPQLRIETAGLSGLSVSFSAKTHSKTCHM